MLICCVILILLYIPVQVLIIHDAYRMAVWEKEDSSGDVLAEPEGTLQGNQGAVHRTLQRRLWWSLKSRQIMVKKEEMMNDAIYDAMGDEDDEAKRWEFVPW